MPLSLSRPTSHEPSPSAPTTRPATCGSSAGHAASIGKRPGWLLASARARARRQAHHERSAQRALHQAPSSVCASASVRVRSRVCARTWREMERGFVRHAHTKRRQSTQGVLRGGCCATATPPPAGSRPNAHHGHQPGGRQAARSTTRTSQNTRASRRGQSQRTSPSLSSSRGEPFFFVFCFLGT